MDAVP
jgi:transposase-like protein